jgi:hypothetical protein
VQEHIISENLEFYHDQGGLLTSKTKLIAALKNNICGKVTRELLKGSIEVIPSRIMALWRRAIMYFHVIIREIFDNDNFTIGKKENDSIDIGGLKKGAEFVSN